MPKNTKPVLEQKLDTIIYLLQHLLCLDLTDRGLSQEEIGKHLHIKKSKIVEMQKGLQKASK